MGFRLQLPQGGQRAGAHAGARGGARVPNGDPDGRRAARRRGRMGPVGVNAVRRVRAPRVGWTTGARAGGRPMTAVAAAPRPFDVCGELPTGMTLLQASAGTGKTFTIAALTPRYLA